MNDPAASNHDSVAGEDGATGKDSPPFTILGRLVEASNATFLVERSRGGERTGEHLVYKPTAGEAPLWDFPRHTLGRREVAAFALSEAAGFGVVPRTIWVGDDAPLGSGSLQDWVETSGDELADLVALDEIPEGWFGIVVGVDEDDNDLALVHADHPALRRLALFDVVANNADRKAGHILRVDECVLGVDHGVSFHVEPKLRTILWGWSGEPLTAEETALLEHAREAAPHALAGWLAPAEVAATTARIDELLAAGHFPEPGEDWPVIPWPPI